MESSSLEYILKVNDERNCSQGAYDPHSGIGCYGKRKPIAVFSFPIMYVPVEILENKFIKSLQKTDKIDVYFERYLRKPYRELSPEGQREARELIAKYIVKVRIKYDFEFWAYSFVKIKNKEGGENISFKLNRPQRRCLKICEIMRQNKKPIRIILLKARQWGGSTFFQVYMAWIQLVHKRNWNSVICAHLKGTASTVRGMYTRLLEEYPAWLLDSEGKIEFSPYEGSSNTNTIKEVSCNVTIGSAETPNSVRGEDTAMAHCTEVGLWKKTDGKTPEDLIRSVCGGIARFPLTIIIYESTANGVGNFFHTQWLRAKEGESDKIPIFVAWFEIEIYREEFISEQEKIRLVETMSSYEHWCFSLGASLENINWYRNEVKKFAAHEDMMAEFPSDDIEAFKHSGEIVFNANLVDSLSLTCEEPKWVGDLFAKQSYGKEALEGIEFIYDHNKELSIWEMPETTTLAKNRYKVIVDVGGRSKKSDNSVIAVFDRIDMICGGVPKIVAQWVGHIDHDLLAWKAVQIAEFYAHGELVIEANTYETENTDGDHTQYILDSIASVYNNLYARKVSSEKIKDGKLTKWGFHTNTSTKTMIIDTMVWAVREKGYVEKSRAAINEMLVYEKKTNGSYGAKDSHHDDILITRMIGVYICYNSLPVILTSNKPISHTLKTTGMTSL